MEPNDFIAKLKADGSNADWCDLAKVYTNYKAIIVKISTKDRGLFSLNVLCILCRNLDKVPIWCKKINTKDLSTLSIDCIREARTLDRPEQVKTLACTYHIHRHITRQNSQIPPELVLKISFMPFESEALLNEYSKTYWNIVADRLNYIENLKQKVSIMKLLPKITEDTLKIVKIYDPAQFCANVIVFLVKKLHFLYNDIGSKDLDLVYMKIFQALTENNLDGFKKLNDSDMLNLYMKLNDCVYVVAENSSKNDFKDSPLTNIIQNCLTLLGHSTELYHCFQSYHLNSFCSILTDKPNLNYIETVINGILLSCETTEKLGYKKAMYSTYPYISQLLRLYIEFNIDKSKRKHSDFTEKIQEKCSKLMLFLFGKLKKCIQLLKCEDCNVKSGLHDALRLSFHIKTLISISLSENTDISNNLPLFCEVMKEQYKILFELCNMGCTNHEKCFRKLQTDIHNTAITLNKQKHFETSIKLFDLYLRYEIRCFKTDVELKNICRGLYNKSICELDCKLHEKALVDGYLSLIFSQNEGFNEKYMSLVIDVKAKSFKSETEDKSEKEDALQLLSVFDACKLAVENNYYGNLKPFLKPLKFSKILKYEFDMYAKLWPSIVPIAGVWKSLNELRKQTHIQWLSVENEEHLLRTLFEVILETPTVARSIHSEHYSNIVTELLDQFHETPPTSSDLQVVYLTLLLLKSEYDFAEAGEKYGWNTSEACMDPDQFQAVCTFPQEHQASRCLFAAVDGWTRLMHDLDSVSDGRALRWALQTAQGGVPALLRLRARARGLQLAHVCAAVARRLGDTVSYVRNAGVILRHVDCDHEAVGPALRAAGELWSQLVGSQRTLQEAIVFVCDSAMYYCRIGSIDVAAKLVQLAQARILDAYEKYPQINLDIAVGRLLEAQIVLCGDAGPGLFAAVNGLQKHYLASCNTGTVWSVRRLNSLTLKLHSSEAGLRATALHRALRCVRRARGSAGVALRAAAAHTHAALYGALLDPHAHDDALTKIDNRLKHILGLQPTNEMQPCGVGPRSQVKRPHFTPQRALEEMRENVVLKRTQTSPSLPCVSVPGYKLAEFLSHHASCVCYGCVTPSCIVLAVHTSGLEAQLYFRARETLIARNYFEGTLNSFAIAEMKLKNIIESYRDKGFEEYIVDYVNRQVNKELGKVKIEILIEAAFLELSEHNYGVADDHVVRIHEILQENEVTDAYLKNEVMNLMIASAELRKTIKKQDLDLEEFENLRISSPVKNVVQPQTPVTKTLPIVKQQQKIVVKEEELPNTKRRVIKLNLDEEETQQVVNTRSRRQFKIPVPITTKPLLENMTPKAKPGILITQPSEEAKTPLNKQQFFTPVQSPEQFFTPNTSIKTYAKKSLRQNIVKNLESEFTPRQKENKAELLDVPKSRSKSTKRTLKRATSPGKIVADSKPVMRNRRLRNPVNFSIDDDNS